MNLFYQEPSATVYCGHALDLKDLPPGSVDMCMTSPPYWGLRSYKTEPQIWDSKDGCRHEWDMATIVSNPQSWSDKSGLWSDNRPEESRQKTILERAQRDRGVSTHQQGFCSLCGAWRGELGLEPTIELYIKHLMQIFGEVKRVLKKTGTCWVVVDDSYAGSGKASGQSIDQVTPKQASNFASAHINIDSGLPAKSLCLIPSRFALAMVENGWILRNDIVWNKPNPMPESVKDRFTTSWEHLFFFAKSKRYFFEQQFEQYTEPLNRWGGDFTKPTDTTDDIDGVFAVQEREGRDRRPNELGRNMRDVWEINTVPSPKHDGIRNFATYPEKLCETPILAGCPSMICKRCGKAREKVYRTEPMKIRRTDWGKEAGNRTASSGTMLEPNKVEFQGYTDCGCNADFESGVVLDPFMGSGTTLAVAKRLGRKAIGIDINENYCKLAVKRLQEIPMAMDLSGEGHG